MSNCIFFRQNHVVVFSPFDISALRLRTLLNGVGSSLPDWEKDPIGASVWWYLKINTKIDDSVTIAFGKGRSGHTFRDFRYLVNAVLNPIMLRKKEHTFIAEDPGYPGLFEMKVVFGEEMK